MAGNIFDQGMQAFDQSYDRANQFRADRANAVAAPMAAVGDFKGAAQAYGQAGLAPQATQALSNQQSMDDRAAAANAKAQQEQAAEAQRKAEGLMRVTDALSTVPQGQRKAALQSYLPLFQSLKIDPSPFLQLDEDHLSDQQLAGFRASLGKAAQDYTVGSVRYSGATNKPIAGFAEIDPHKTVYAVGDADPNAPPAAAPAAAPGAPAPAAPIAPVAYSPRDRDALARMMVTEAGGEGPQGMVAVGQVAMNRLKANYGGAQSMSDVVNAPNQFEGMKNAANVSPADLQRAQTLADHILQGQAPDITNGATHFLNPQLQADLGRAQPAWATGGNLRIGRHVFYGGGAQSAPAASTLSGGAGADTLPPAAQIPGMHLVSQAKPEWQDMADGRQRNIITGKVEGTPNSDDTPLDPATVELLAGKYLNNGTLPPMGQGKTGTRNRDLILNAATQQAKALGLDANDLVAGTATGKAAAGALGKVATIRAQVEASEQTVLKNGQAALQLANQAGGPTGVPVLNRWIQAGRKNIAGDPQVAAFHLAVGTVADEYAKVMTTSTGTGGQGTSDSARMEAYRRINTAQTPAQLQAVISQMKVEMDNRASSLRDTEAGLRNTVRNGGQANGLGSPASATVEAPAAQKVRKYNPTTGRLE